MVYEWEDKKAECERLYVGEKKSVPQIMAYFHERGFTPSRRAFQTQFKRWDFPNRQNFAEKNPVLIARIRELWEQNYTQKDMVTTMQSEGHNITHRELIRLRLKLGLLLRQCTYRPPKKEERVGGVQKRKAQKKKQEALKVVPGRGLINQLGNATLVDSSSSEEDSDSDENSGHDEDSPQEVSEEESHQEAPTRVAGSRLPPPSQEEIVRRQMRQEQRQLESDEKWRTRKRRRRTRGWAGLPPDAPGEPPRFPSETTIDEAKAYLGLDNDMYRNLREDFEVICKENNLLKKTVGGPEKWSELVQKLIRDDDHLAGVFQHEPDVFQNPDALFRPKGPRALSLDVICMDVTKRLRVIESRMTLADAKNALYLNPQQTRQVRSVFDAKLQAENFTNKLEAGGESWTALKQAWVNETELLSQAFAQGEADPEYSRKFKALEVIARDVMKRQQQERCKLNPNKKQHQGPGPGPANATVKARTSALQRKAQQATTMRPSNTVAPSQDTFAAALALDNSSDLQIDPSLLLAASDAAILPTAQYLPPRQPYQQTRTPHQPFQTSHTQAYTPYYPATSSTFSMPLPVYFRLHPHSATPLPSKTVWLSILRTASVAELSNLAVREHAGISIHKIEGLIVYREDAQNREVAVEVGDDEELKAYLEHVNGQGGAMGKATFVVLLG